jgi:protein-L-isoaspartate(D-aspartate) O-methyltransferase
VLSYFCLNNALNIPFGNFQRFWSGSSINKNKALVEHLQNCGTISSKKVSEVMETIDRALFVPDGTAAYVDSPMAIGYNATISAPHMHATCLQLLEENLKSGMHVLDVGSGFFLVHPLFFPPTKNLSNCLINYF